MPLKVISRETGEDITEDTGPTTTNKEFVDRSVVDGRWETRCGYSPEDYKPVYPEFSRDRHVYAERDGWLAWVGRAVLVAVILFLTFAIFSLFG